jgi:hypothetical protein
MKTSKCITYKGHQIEVLRYATINPRNGRESIVMWNANVDGVPVQSYSLYFRRAVIAKAKQQIDLLGASAQEPK